ncbi:hypothetical protein HHK36_031036 [Tetracentron sinense]|uniref:F-box protein n=1 Tax=Tetracentron sinense TaxID=13715 RepID=A0A835CZ81_TETSI|nr:hypothetical protein HHK36_031036 [Tetracentron sinense]
MANFNDPILTIEEEIISSSCSFSFADFPEDVQLCILSFLKPSEIASFSCTSKRFVSLCRSDSKLWFFLCDKRWGSKTHIRKWGNGKIGFKVLYKTLNELENLIGFWRRNGQGNVSVSTPPLVFFEWGPSFITGSRVSPSKTGTYRVIKTPFLWMGLSPEGEPVNVLDPDCRFDSSGDLVRADELEVSDADLVPVNVSFMGKNHIVMEENRNFDSSYYPEQRKMGLSRSSSSTNVREDDPEIVEDVTGLEIYHYILCRILVVFYNLFSFLYDFFIYSVLILLQTSGYSFSSWAIGVLHFYYSPDTYLAPPCFNVLFEMGFGDQIIGSSVFNYSPDTDLVPPCYNVLSEMENPVINRLYEGICDDMNLDFFLVAYDDIGGLACRRVGDTSEPFSGYSPVFWTSNTKFIQPPFSAEEEYLYESRIHLIPLDAANDIHGYPPFVEKEVVSRILYINSSYDLVIPELTGSSANPWHVEGRIWQYANGTFGFGFLRNNFIINLKHIALNGCLLDTAEYCCN